MLFLSSISPREFLTSLFCCKRKSAVEKKPINLAGRALNALATIRDPEVSSREKLEEAVRVRKDAEDEAAKAAVKAEEAASEAASAGEALKAEEAASAGEALKQKIDKNAAVAHRSLANALNIDYYRNKQEEKTFVIRAALERQSQKLQHAALANESEIAQAREDSEIAKARKLVREFELHQANDEKRKTLELELVAMQEKRTQDFQKRTQDFQKRTQDFQKRT